MLRGGELSRSLRRRVRSIGRRLREARMFARAMASKHHPNLAQIVPIRRCNLACTDCNEFDAVSAPVPLAEIAATRGPSGRARHYHHYNQRRRADATSELHVIIRRMARILNLGFGPVLYRTAGIINQY